MASPLRRPEVHVALLTLVGGVLRFWGVLHGFRDGYVYHLDAVLAIQAAWHQHLGGSWVGYRFGVAYSALVRGAMLAVDTAGRLVGYPIDWSYPGIAAASSLLTATLGTATVPLVYWLGARAHGRATGALAAALLAVSPLHSFQSHYPYRDVPMVFFLTLALAGCVVIANRATPALCTGTFLAAMVAAALKPTGLVVVAPLAVALALGLTVRGVRRSQVLLTLAGLVLAVSLGIAWLRWLDPRLAFGEVGWVLTYFPHLTVSVQQGLGRATRILVQWLGLPLVIATGLGAAWSMARRRPGDLVLLAMLLPGFGVTALYRYLDERFLVFLLPGAAVLVARVGVDAWRVERARSLVRLGVALTLASLVAGGLVRSAWQGMLLSLPDTRALAGRWADAHLPRTIRVALEEYYPLGVQTWPRATFFDPRQSVQGEAAKADVLITSSLEHGRYLDDPDLSPPEMLAFFRTLPQALPLVKEVALAPLGFIHPTIRVYAPGAAPGPPAPRLFLPRPYDARWNAGVSLLDAGAYDRDDRTVLLSGAQRYTATLASGAPVEEVAVFVLNGPERSRVRVRVGWTSRTRELVPGEWRVLRFRPRWPWPMRPALYGFEVGLIPEGTRALVQLRNGAREIGETYASWGRWAEALPYLDRVVRATPADLEAQLLLATAHRELGQPAQAQVVIERAEAAAPDAVRRYRALAREDLAPAAWAHAFREMTGLDAGLLAFSLGQTIAAEDTPQEEAGRRTPDPAAEGGLSVVFERTRERPGAVVSGPRVLYLPRGAYRARFFLRAWDAAPGTGSVAVARVFAETRLLAAREVTLRDLGPGAGFLEVVVPFVHPDQLHRIAVQVEAVGRASLAVDRIRLEPDLRALVRQRARGLDPPGTLHEAQQAGR